MWYGKMERRDAVYCSKLCTNLEASGSRYKGFNLKCWFNGLDNELRNLNLPPELTQSCKTWLEAINGKYLSSLRLHGEHS